MRRIKKIVRSISIPLLLTAATSALLWFFFFRSIQSPVIEIPFSEKRPFNEETAMELGFAALAKSGLGGFHPQAYWKEHPNQYFTRDEARPDFGYIFFKDSTGEREYRIDLERADNKVLARVTRVPQ